MSETLHADISAILEQSRLCWNVQDYAGLRALWDPQEAEPFYIAEEIETPIVGWSALDAYWNANLTLLQRIEVRYSDLRVKTIGPDLAVAVYALRFALKLAGPRHALGGGNRVTALFRHRLEGWRYCHYVEAPLSPIVYMRKLYEKDIDADLLR